MAWTTPRTWVDGEFETASIFNPHVRDNLNDLDARTQTGTWIAPTLLNSWVDLAGAQQTTQYKVRHGIVYVQCAIRSGTVTANTPLFVLPVGYRPLASISFDAVTSSTAVTARIDVLATGSVNGVAGLDATRTMFCFSFPADA